MYYILTLLVSSLILHTSSSNIATKSHSSNDEKLIIRITSSDPNEEIIFEGSYLFGTEGASLNIVNQKTPFTVQEHTCYVAGIFHKKSGKALLRFQLLSSKDGKEKIHCNGKNTYIILGTKMPWKPYEYFIHKIRTFDENP